MKHFIAALVCLTAVTLLCAFGTKASTDVIDDLLNTLDRMPPNAGAVPPEATEISNGLLQMWEDDFFIISMMHPHEHLDEVKEKMVNLQSYSDTGEYAEWKQAHASLKEALQHLKDLLEANIDNIL